MLTIRLLMSAPSNLKYARISVIRYSRTAAVRPTCLEMNFGYCTTPLRGYRTEGDDICGLAVPKGEYSLYVDLSNPDAGN